MGQEPKDVSKTEAVRRAMAALGGVSAVELAAYVERHFGLKIDPRYIPVVKASVRELEHLERAREAARRLAEELAAKQKGKTPPDGKGC